MLGLFASELKHRPHAIVVIEIGVRVIKHERKDELLNQSEQVEIAMSANVIEHQIFSRGQKVERFDPRQVTFSDAASALSYV